MITYPVRTIPTDDGQYVVRFVDVPEAAAVGLTEAEALSNAQAVLETVLSSYCVDGRPIPAPSRLAGAPTVATARFSLLGAEVPRK